MGLREYTRRRSHLRLGEAIDRLFAERAIDPGLEVKGQQLLKRRCGFGRERHYSNLGWIAGLRNAPKGISPVVSPVKIGNNG
jgi:hypothetical protein